MPRQTDPVTEGIAAVAARAMFDFMEDCVTAAMRWG